MAGIDACGRARKCGNSTQNAFPNSLDRLATCPSINNRETQVASIDLERLDIEQLPELLAKAQSELASREKQGRRDLRAELERRVAAKGYKIADIFPELGAASSSSARRKWPAKYRDPQNTEQPWSGLGRTPKWVQAILEERGIDRAAFKSIPMYQIHSSS